MICAFLIAATSACSGVESKASLTAAPTASLTASQTATSQPSQTSVTVSLYHCGFDPLKHNGKTWEVPFPPPFDGTTAPQKWKGTGRVIALTADHLRYRDDSGIEVDFVPDDGKTPPLCA